MTRQFRVVRDARRNREVRIHNLYGLEAFSYKCLPRPRRRQLQQRQRQRQRRQRQRQQHSDWYSTAEPFSCAKNAEFSTKSHKKHLALRGNPEESRRKTVLDISKSKHEVQDC